MLSTDNNLFFLHAYRLYKYIQLFDYHLLKSSLLWFLNFIHAFTNVTDIYVYVLTHLTFIVCLLTYLLARIWIGTGFYCKETEARERGSEGVRDRGMEGGREG